MSDFTETLIRLAEGEIGVTEVDGSNCGPRVNQYKEACPDLPSKVGWAWCAAFICWLVREAMRICKVDESATFKRPKTAVAYDFANWSLRQGKETQTKRDPGGDIKAGDIVIFTFSHIGLAVEDASGSTVETIEGNTDAQGSREGGGVFRKTRKLSQIRARIRFTI